MAHTKQFSEGFNQGAMIDGGLVPQLTHASMTKSYLDLAEQAPAARKTVVRMCAPAEVPHILDVLGIAHLK